MGQELHQSVLLHETVDALNIKPDGIYVDMTLGRGGHTEYLLSQLTTGKVIAFDQDPEAISYVQNFLNEDIRNGRLILVKDNFRNLLSNLQRLGINEVDGIIYDLGVSSPQLDDAKRGFSYRLDARLDMRMDNTQKLDAYEIVNRYPIGRLINILDWYGDEKFAKRIAFNIGAKRDVKPIETTGELAEIIKAAIPAAARRHGGHPAKKSFQAIRIVVNDEIEALKDSLREAVQAIKVNGVISVITFQPLEDKIVAKYFRSNSRIDIPKGLPVLPDDATPLLKVSKRKPVLPDNEEIDENRRAHSAKLRVAIKLRKEK